jgi:hypothetical protein
MIYLGLIGHDDSGPYLGIIGTWFHCMACRLASPGPGEGVATWASPIPGDSGPHVGLLALVNLVLTWSSPSPGDSGNHLGLTLTW